MTPPPPQKKKKNTHADSQHKKQSGLLSNTAVNKSEELQKFFDTYL
jgi:hypothetical protein